MDRRKRRAGQVLSQENGENIVSNLLGVKRTAETRSPTKQASKKTRTAFGDITNRENAKLQIAGKKGGKASKKASKKDGKAVIVVPKSQPLTNSQQERGDLSWEVIELSQPSQESNSSQSSISSLDASEYVDDLNLRNLKVSQEVKKEEEPQSWVDIDQDVQDTFQVSLYAHHIFEYYKEREQKFLIKDYMPEQTDLSSSMRAILVDWLVEVQENFELNHETLYLAVKLVDHYLALKPLTRDQLQLLGATAMFIACKFDERMPPVLDDFLYICDDAYNRDQLLTMERTILISIGFDLGFPLSYRFLRRFAKCGKAPLETLTLARWMLEMSLMDYSFVCLPDSKMASACLLLAMKMKDSSANWDATLVHYTGYNVCDIVTLVKRLNAMISAPPSKQLATIRTKYSHKVFHEVALTPALTPEVLSALESC